MHKRLDLLDEAIFDDLVDDLLKTRKFDWNRS